VTIDGVAGRVEMIVVQRNDRGFRCDDTKCWKIVVHDEREMATARGV